MIDQGKHSVLGVRIDAVDYEAAVDRIVTAARQQRPMAVSALAVHGVMTGVLNSAHRYRLNQFDLLVPDGQPVRWALSWLHGAKLADRVYGPNLMLELCRRASAEHLPIFLFGGDSQMLAALKNQLNEQFPELQIAGMRPSAFRQLTHGGARRGSRGNSCQRRADRVRRPRLPATGSVCVRDARAVGYAAGGGGCGVRISCGQAAAGAPALQRRGLEWLYRFAQEPRRLWKRYLVLNPLYLTLLGLQFVGLWKSPDDHGERPAEELRYG